jgi:hypothetical protein
VIEFMLVINGRIVVKNANTALGSMELHCWKTTFTSVRRELRWNSCKKSITVKICARLPVRSVAPFAPVDDVAKMRIHRSKSPAGDH